MYENSFWGNILITLNDYLYNGDTVLKIIHSYENDLRQSAEDAHNEIDLLHCEFLQQLIDLLEHNDFLTSQSQRIREFYKYMAAEYPSLAFTFKGRIKSRSGQSLNSTEISWNLSPSIMKKRKLFLHWMK